MYREEGREASQHSIEGEKREKKGRTVHFNCSHRAICRSHCPARKRKMANAKAEAIPKTMKRETCERRWSVSAGQGRERVGSAR